MTSHMYIFEKIAIVALRFSDEGSGYDKYFIGICRTHEIIYDKPNMQDMIALGVNILESSEGGERV